MIRTILVAVALIGASATTSLLTQMSPNEKQKAVDAAVGLELTHLLGAFLKGAATNSVETHERFWAEDLIYTGSGGRRVAKAQIMKEVREAPAPNPDDPKVAYRAEEVRVQRYGTTAVVAFRLVSEETNSDGKIETARFLNTGTFVKRDGRWQVVAWQATKLPSPATAPTPSR